MGRKIRFRAWHKSSKRMIYDIQNEFEERIELGMDCFASYLENEDFVIEQYTGMKDKNSKEIAINDIVRMHYFGEYLGVNGGVGEADMEVVGVVCIDSLGTYTKVGDKKYYWTEYLEDAEWCACNDQDNPELEIIGSVHKDPELLAAEK